MSHAKFHCNKLTTVQDIQDYASLLFGTQCIVFVGHGVRTLGFKRHSTRNNFLGLKGAALTRR